MNKTIAIAYRFLQASASSHASMIVREAEQIRIRHEAVGHIAARLFRDTRWRQRSDPHAQKCWCKKVTGTVPKKRLDDVEILPFNHVNKEAAFTPYLYQFFV
jgi:hypothetical protein